MSKTTEEIIEEAQTFTVAGLSLNRPIGIGDVKWAVEQGFYAGRKNTIPLSEHEEIVKQERQQLIKDLKELLYKDEPLNIKLSRIMVYFEKLAEKKE